MEKKELLTKFLALTGTMFAWIPLLAPVFFSVAGLLIRGGPGRFDYLMPAELFLLALAGGVLLVWAALRAHARLKLVSWSFATAVATLFAGQALAVATGLASGETEPTGLPWVLVVASLVIYTLALLFLAIGGVLLLKDLFKKPEAVSAPG